MDKPIIILFHGFGSSKIFWEYDYVGTDKLRKNNFLSSLKKLGIVYTFNLKFFNTDYYYKNDNEEQRLIWNNIYKKYKPHTKDINFNMKDLDYKNICNQIYNKVIEKFGDNKIFIWFLFSNIIF